MNITFLGAGAVGSYFAGRMIEAGHNVSLIARGQRLHQLRDAGLEVVSPIGNIAHSVAATDNSGELPSADILILTVKNYSFEAACAQHFDYIKKCGYILTLQNGIDAPQIVSGMFSVAYVLAGQAYISAKILNDGKVIHSGEHAAINYGAFNNRVNLAKPSLKQVAKRLASRAMNRNGWSPCCAPAKAQRLTSCVMSSAGSHIRRAPSSA